MAFAFAAGVSPAYGAQEESRLFDEIDVQPMHLHEPTERTTFSRLAVPTVLGSLAGTAFGGLWGTRLGWGDSDYRGLESALLFGILGGTAGSATGAWLAGRRRGDVGYGSAVLAAGVGIVGGVLAATTLTTVTRGELGFKGLYIGFGLGQGLVAAAAASSDPIR